MSAEKERQRYSGPERRVAFDEIEDLLDRKLTEHERAEETRTRLIVTEVIADLERRAFPDGADSHGAYHLSKINAAKAEEKFWSELKLDLAKKGLWGIVTILAGMVVLGFSAWISTIQGAPK